MERYQIRFFYDWGCGWPFWSGNDAATVKFPEYCIDPKKLGLSEKTCERIDALGVWHDTALNWNYPPDPSPWRQEECDRFNAAVDDLVETIRAELGEEYELLDQQSRFQEDPDLDRYLADPQNFRR
ncbi:hypothetical protein [Leptolyngbya ohadii]|uniref:hypothetical protein n=1 Tax=Leptolyngbya ohadii TaxID=1962290 RepID=UPI000B59A5D8|nr:hypothetical protein [Leptolyngbya ohadii]